MNNAAMNPISAIPGGVDEFVMIVGFIENNFALNVATRGLELCIRLNDVANGFAIMF
jgi:hypothetical protein